MRIGIIGGRGGMGTLFSRIFSDAGHEVLVSGRATPLSNADLVRACEVVIVSVPIRSTVPVIREIAPLLSGDQLLCDFTSLKAASVAAMLETRADVLGLHPMFGPSVSSLQNQTIVACPARVAPGRADVLLAVFREAGAKVTTMDPLEHDRLMAVVQGLTHFTTLSLAGAMRRLSVDLPALLSVTSPVYQIEMAVIGRILGQDPGLYGPILGENPAVPEVLDAFEAAAAEVRGAVESGDDEVFARLFNKDAAFFADYIPHATEDSEALIRCLAEK
ncbi:MAG: prephenate dehydrogenase/arogenate dehydrogenase family protein [Methanofollis sp.]|uniref:prephenate dehydrogenase/arogenate dehydrogenase family protein n=1 Tax=Methanofollis sp. TaxID=2052835 RepID=UPI00262C97C5|nr:prephenate dehydrogenase/arogenate dehydrogenase family protein [Methanofollis sp.]MDD4254737.1 prephenate dehydrogenase/arogenate dehydrogenase family protein [Methanofollis sp.]